MFKSLVYFSLFALLLTSLWGCKENPVLEPEPDMFAAAPETAVPDLGLNLQLWAADSLFAGYNPLLIELTDQASGETVTGMDLTVVPRMTMPNMIHSAPVEQPDAANSEGRYPFAVAFIMASTGMSYWELLVTVRDPNSDQSQEVILPLYVKAPEEVRVRNFFAADDSARLFLSLVQPTEPIVGINEFTLAAHYRENMMSFPPLEGLSFEIEPTMPSMNHGSPNNVDPTYDAKGHYTGQVNFTMDGWWQVHVRVLRNGSLIGETDFNITFQAR